MLEEFYQTRTNNGDVVEESQILLNPIEELGVILEIPELQTTTTGQPILEASDSREEEEEDKYSNDKGLEDNKVLYFTVDGPEPIRRIVL